MSQHEIEIASVVMARASPVRSELAASFRNAPREQSIWVHALLRVHAIGAQLVTLKPPASEEA